MKSCALKNAKHLDGLRCLLRFVPQYAKEGFAIMKEDQRIEHNICVFLQEITVIFT